MNKLFEISEIELNKFKLKYAVINSLAEYSKILIQTHDGKKCVNNLFGCDFSKFYTYNYRGRIINIVKNIIVIGFHGMKCAVIGSKIDNGPLVNCNLLPKIHKITSAGINLLVNSMETNYSIKYTMPYVEAFIKKSIAKQLSKKTRIIDSEFVINSKYFQRNVDSILNGNEILRSYTLSTDTNHIVIDDLNLDDVIYIRKSEILEKNKELKILDHKQLKKELSEYTLIRFYYNCEKTTLETYSLNNGKDNFASNSECYNADLLDCIYELIS